LKDEIGHYENSIEEGKAAIEQTNTMQLIQWRTLY